MLEPSGESYECGCGGNSRTPSIRSTMLKKAFLRHAPALLPLSLRKPFLRFIPLEPDKSHFPSPLEGEGAVVLEPSGESYECGCGVKNNNSRIPPYGLRPLPPQGGQMPALAINKLRIPLPIRGERSNSSNLLRHSESSIYSGAKNL